MEHQKETRILSWSFFFFVVLTLLVTWPLVLHFTERVPGYYKADNYEYLWKMWWFKHTLIETQQNPLFAPHIFYPQGFSLAHAELTPLHTILGLPLIWAWGEIPTYNFFALLSYLISGWVTFLLVYRLTTNVWAGVFAGVLFALSPYHHVRYGGILPLMAIQGIPIFFYGLENWAQTFTIRWAAITALGFIVAAWASPYYAAGLALLAPVYVLARIRISLAFFRSKQTWTSLGLMLALVIIFVVPVAWPYLQLGKQIDLEIPLDEVDFWSASLTDYLVPTGVHPLWGTFVRERLLSVPVEFEQISLEFVLGVGYLALLFAFYGWKFGRHPAIKGMLWFTLVATLFSFGPRLHLGRHPIVIPASENLVNQFHALMNFIGGHLFGRETYTLLETTGITIPLPALLIRWMIPFFSGMRAWNRFAVFVSFGISVLAGIGFARYIERELKPQSKSLSYQRIMILIFIGLAIFELWPARIPLQPVESRPVDEWLATQLGQFNLMELPLNSALSAPQMQYTRYHGKNIAYGYGTYFPIWYRQQYPELGNCPSSACLTRLQSWQVKYILLNRDALEPTSTLEFQLDSSGALTRIAEFEAIVVYQLLP
ncbi:MAG: hypothetical protein HUU38_09470 [Anaerolineales bacterium]|nr:hypothetical protein [Anaerolineales bacterium]